MGISFNLQTPLCKVARLQGYQKMQCCLLSIGISHKSTSSRHSFQSGGGKEFKLMCY